jgi:hypothetical protein
MKINVNKLTDIDRQILSLFGLNQARVTLMPNTMVLAHEKLGVIMLERRQLRPGLYMAFQPLGTNNRVLSWRGRLLARQLQKRLLSSPLNEVKQAPVMGAAAQPNPPSLARRQAAGGLTGAAMPLTAEQAIRQAQQQLDNHLRSQWVNLLQANQLNAKFPSPP